MSDPAELWWFLPIGYLITIALETPVLLVGLSPHHSIGRKLLAGVWLTACTYPIVVLVLPLTVEATYGRIPYLIVAETFAPLAECALFTAAFGWDAEPKNSRLVRWSTLRDWVAIVLANLVSFLSGEWWYGVTAAS